MFHWLAIYVTEKNAPFPTTDGEREQTAVFFECQKEPWPELKVGQRIQLNLSPREGRPPASGVYRIVARRDLLTQGGDREGTVDYWRLIQAVRLGDEWGVARPAAREE